MNTLLLEALYIMSVGMLVVFLFLLLLLLAMRLLRLLSATNSPAPQSQLGASHERAATVPVAAIIAAVQQFRQDHQRQQD